MLTTTLPTATHTENAHNYEGGAFTTIAYFVFAGVVHRAVRFWRADFLSTGKLEIYTLEPYSVEHSSCTALGWYTYTAGDFLRYADESNPSRVGVAAMSAIANASKGTYSNIHTEQAARYAAMEIA